MKFFYFLKSHISLASNGMGVSLRESRYAIAKLLEKEGFEYELYSDFIDIYENGLLEQYSKAKEKEDLKNKQ